MRQPEDVAHATKTPLRNVQSVVLGSTAFKAWYPSFYPEDLVGSKAVEKLYVCKHCFRYTLDVVPYLLHTRVCEHKEHPLGTCIYTSSPTSALGGDGSVYSVYEVDGEEEKLFAQNLSLFAKLFLDNKSVFFDVAGFHYYLLYITPRDGSPDDQQIVGFFSKEKMSWDQNNLACILVFPPWQRKGLGKLLMGASYELSKREGRIGGPEKPLSELGRKSYLAFWQARIAREVLKLRSNRSLELEELAKRSWMNNEDVAMALKEMEVCEIRAKGDGVGISKARVRDWVKQCKVDLTEPIEEGGFTKTLLNEEISG